MRPLVKYIAVCVALTAAISCGNDSTGPLARQIGSVTIVNAPSTIDQRFSAQLTATVRDKSGATVSGIPVRWWSSAPMTVVVEPSETNQVAPVAPNPLGLPNFHGADSAD